MAAARASVLATTALATTASSSQVLEARQLAKAGVAVEKLFLAKFAKKKLRQDAF